MQDEIKEALFSGFTLLSDEETIKTKKAQLQIVEEMENRAAYEFVAPVFREALAGQLRHDGKLSESEIQSHIMEKCEQIKRIQIAEKKKEFGIDVYENPEIEAERTRDKMVEIAKRLNEVVT